MNFDEYQAAALATAVYPNPGEMTREGITYTVLGLASEAGEVAGALKRVIRDDGWPISDERYQQIVDELGDVLWYVATAAREMGCSLDTVAQWNLAKLTNRAERGTLHGAGDKR